MGNEIFGVADGITAAANQTITFWDTIYEYPVTLAVNTTFTFDTSNLSRRYVRRRLRVTMPSPVVTVSFPASVVWDHGFPPNMNVGSVYLLEFETRDGGTSWHGQWVAEVEVS